MLLHFEFKIKLNKILFNSFNVLLLEFGQAMYKWSNSETKGDLISVMLPTGGKCRSIIDY